MKISPSQQEAYALMHDGVQAFARMEQVGLKIDVEYCRKAIRRTSKQVRQLTEELRQSKIGKLWSHVYSTKVNYNSDYQLSNILFKKKKLEPITYTNGGNPSTDNEALTALSKKVDGLDKILQIRKKIKSVEYLARFYKEQVDGVLHPFFNLHTTKTFRSSSDRINFQNVPKRDVEQMQVVRRAILPRKGNLLLEVDYSGIEVRISACYHKDPEMLSYIKNPESDMHRDMAVQIYKLDRYHGESKLRYNAKNGFVFPQFYGDYWGNCARNLWEGKNGIKLGDGTSIAQHLKNKGIGTYHKFEKHIKEVEQDFWGRRFKVYHKWRETNYYRYQRKGYIDLLTGFRCNGIMGRKETSNYPIQGTAFHCLLWSLIQIDKICYSEKWKSKPIGQIHDSIVLDVAQEELDHVMYIIQRVMCREIRKHWRWLIVPLAIEAETTGTDQPWSEKKSISK